MTDRMSKQEFKQMIRQRAVVKNIYEAIQHAKSKGFTGLKMAQIIEANLSNDFTISKRHWTEATDGKAERNKD